MFAENRAENRTENRTENRAQNRAQNRTQNRTQSGPKLPTAMRAPVLNRAESKPKPPAP